MTASAQGIDYSEYQAPLTAVNLKGMSFAWCKATNGAGGTDPNFAANWATIKGAGIVRGAYHELVPADDLSTQVSHFVLTVDGRGLEPGDMLAVVASDYPGVTTDLVRSFCDQTRALTGPNVAIVIYSDLSVAETLTTCTGYPLWVAYPSDTAPGSVAPWSDWLFWQWSWNPVDQDAFNGTTAALDSWIATYKEAGMQVTKLPPGDWRAAGPLILIGPAPDGSIWETKTYDGETWTTPVKQ